MQCNIDAKGKAVRLIMGSMGALIGLALLLIYFTALAEGRWTMIAGIIAIVIGGFGIFEGAAGWCAVRAMGMKTRL